MSLLAALALWAFAGSAPVEASAGQPSDQHYRVIAHPDTTVRRLNQTFLRDAFLKKRRSWPNGTTIRPVDLHAAAPVRRHFSEQALGRTVAAVKAYWQQRVFAGRDVPPPELARDREVIEYVRNNDGALGYVSAAAEVGGLVVVQID